MAASTQSLKKIPHALFDLIRPVILRANYYLGHYKSAIWLFGDGRSGTTFVADLINFQRHYRELFEPFHPVYVKQMQGLPMHMYLRPGFNSPRMNNMAMDVFTGRLVAPFVDSSSTRMNYRNLIIKDIFANLLARWVLEQLPEVKIKPVLLVRNPFAVALSKYKKKGWNWMTDPSGFLKQQELVDDYLQGFVEHIQKVEDDYIVRQVMIWSVIHYVPLRQFEAGELYVLFYENLLADPHTELRSLLSYLDIAVTDQEFDRMLSKMSVPSRVSGDESTIVQGVSPVDSWRNEITYSQHASGIQILKLFGLDHIYGDSTIPQISQEDIFISSKNSHTIIK